PLDHVPRVLPDHERRGVRPGRRGRLPRRPVGLPGPRPPSVKAVLFDYGGVLTEPMQRMFAAIAADCGAETAELAALLVGGYEDGDHPWHQVERGELPFAELCRWGAEEGHRRG